ncbi:MAG: 2-hydroxyacid dehydrogenase [Rhizobiaceae bacterium]|nr:2-hydroxyacid dehydrogenase [Rhizobiaceae bacterium]
MQPGLLLIGGATPRMMDKMNAHFEVHQLSEITDFNTWATENGETIEAVATNGHDGVKPDIMAALPNLKVISCYGVGYDAINTDTARSRGIMVTHTPGVLNADVANLAILLMLATSRCLVRDDKWVRSGNWANRGNAPLTTSIENKKVGILGLGRIGGEIARKLEVFGCDISYHTRNAKDVAYTYRDNLVEMAREVDYLVAITPGGEATNKLVNREVIDALGPEGTLINVARGSVVDEQELVLALQEGRLGAAGLDVFENEPHAPEALFEMENVVLTPHTASATVETRQAMGDLTVENLIRFFKEGKVSTPVPECADMG